MRRWIGLLAGCLVLTGLGACGEGQGLGQDWSAANPGALASPAPAPAPVAAAADTTASSPVAAASPTTSVAEVEASAPAPASASASASAAAPADTAAAGPVWQDEFDTPGLPDPKRWTYDVHGNAGWWPNSEMQYYAAERWRNARVEDGKLIIEAHREWLDRSEFSDYGGQGYTSARLVSRQRGSWTFGRVEVRAKLPCARGTWPAIWMLPEQGVWPDDGEIDIMEHVGFDPNVAHATIHTQSFNHVKGTEKSAGVQVDGDACKEFHRYQLRWTASRITMSVDDKPYFTFDNDGAGQRASWPFDKPMYLLLNLAVGGTWGGRQGVDEASFPQRMEVDYVRVYRE